jgi:AraC-like DNA-binding protein
MTQKDVKYTEFKIAVPTDYKNVFYHFYFAQNKTDHTISKLLLPTFQTILIFNFGEKPILHSKNNTTIEINKCIVLGPIKQAFVYSLKPNSEILVANFKNDAFYRFFGKASVAEHFPINPDSLLKENCCTALWGELNKIIDSHLRVNYILEFCKPYLRDPNLIVEKLTTFNDETLKPIKQVASEQNQTERNIQLNHKKHLGYTSKESIRFLRFLKAIEHVQRISSSSTKIDWHEIVNKCGYYDQSQLIHDFKHFINISPSKYLKFQQDICTVNTQ